MNAKKPAAKKKSIDLDTASVSHQQSGWNPAFPQNRPLFAPHSGEQRAESFSLHDDPFFLHDRRHLRPLGDKTSVNIDTP
jgi:hypothetical protein